MDDSQHEKPHSTYPQVPVSPLIPSLPLSPSPREISYEPMLMLSMSLGSSIALQCAHLSSIEELLLQCNKGLVFQDTSMKFLKYVSYVKLDLTLRDMDATLNDHCLLNLFSYLDLPSLIHVSVFSPRFLAIAQDAKKNSR